ncbi:nitroreductase family protein [Nitrincola schmidtii]|uniref:nitroreductase family protein n=1 Tax=Nitrincola schmidtii TaxID=1730894 RepID=UPI00124CB68A|nr:nitroreductase family protein [Nitrincola schmidtii]
MNSIDLLLNRVSSPVLDLPAPTADQLDIMYRAALRAPDHGGMRPYRFLQIEGEGRQKLGQVFVEAAQQSGDPLTEAELEKLQNAPLRAPTIVVVIATLQPHPKVPEIEQQLSAGCAAHGLVLAAFAQGVDAIWRSGKMAFNGWVNQRLGLEANEQIVGFIYLGKARKHKIVPCPAVGEFVQLWGKS